MIIIVKIALWLHYDFKSHYDFKYLHYDFKYPSTMILIPCTMILILSHIYDLQSAQVHLGTHARRSYQMYPIFRR